jgi:ubiquinone/menaquinone biosynthesis C-methylase UbiE|tara:strand:+ start:5774 stop:6748 length:975 start_codon:yes stop_codon:yes gene_type:complete
MKPLHLPHTSDAWSNYWKKGFSTTFVSDETDTYSGATRDHWLEVFSHLNVGNSVVDLGTGNGAILEIGISSVGADQKQLTWIAVDYADLANSKFYRGHPEIQVHDHTSIEDTPLADESVDLAVSQFGFEYSDTEKASIELSRFLAPGARFRAAIHHADSSISLHSKSALQQIAWCQRSELTQTSVKLLRRLSKLNKSNRDPRSDPRAEELKSFFNQMAERLNGYGDQMPDASHIGYFLNELGSLFNPERAGELSLHQKIGIVEQLEIDTRGYERRMVSMLNAGLDNAGVEMICDQLSSAGLKVDLPVAIESESAKMAWKVGATK